MSKSTIFELIAVLSLELNLLGNGRILRETPHRRYPDRVLQTQWRTGWNLPIGPIYRVNGGPFGKIFGNIEMIIRINIGII